MGLLGTTGVCASLVLRRLEQDYVIVRDNKERLQRSLKFRHNMDPQSGRSL